MRQLKIHSITQSLHNPWSFQNPLKASIETIESILFLTPRSHALTSLIFSFFFFLKKKDKPCSVLLCIFFRLRILSHVLIFLFISSTSRLPSLCLHLNFLFNLHCLFVFYLMAHAISKAANNLLHHIRSFLFYFIYIYQAIPNNGSLPPIIPFILLPRNFISKRTHC
jgi:hypothetical protein